MNRRVIDIKRLGESLVISLQSDKGEFGRLAEFCNGPHSFVQLEGNGLPNVQVTMMEVNVDGGPTRLRLTVYLLRAVEVAIGRHRRVSLPEGALEALADCLAIPAEALTKHRSAAPDSA